METDRDRLTWNRYKGREGELMKGKGYRTKNNKRKTGREIKERERERDRERKR